MNRYRGTILVILTILIAFFIRFLFIGLPNLYYDEMGILVGAKLLLNEGLSPWEYSHGQPPPPLIWFSSISFLLFGVSEFSLRIVQTFFGTLTIVLLYFVAKQWYNKKIAILAALLLAVSPLHVAYSRLGVNSDIIETFFILIAIFVMEYCFAKRLNKKEELFMNLLSGAMFGVSFLAKFNALILWIIYWIFILARYPKMSFKLSVRRFIISNIAAFVVIIASTGLKLSNIFYLTYGIAYLTVAQSTFSANPLYYRFLLLVDALSLLVFLVFIVSIICILVNCHKKRPRNDILCISLVLGYLLITILQPRAAARHFLIIMPFIAISVSKFLFDIKVKKNKNKLINAIIFVLIASSLFWSIYEIRKDISYTVWNDVGDYINKNVQKDANIFSFYPYWPLAVKAGNSTYYTHYIKRNVVMNPSIKSIKTGDTFVIGNFDIAFNLARTEPFSTLEVFGQEIYRKEIKPYPRTEKFIKENAQLIKAFYCGKEECIWLYQIDKMHEEAIKQFGQDEKWSYFDSEESKINFFLYSCNLIKKPLYANVIKNLNKNAIMSINRKCKDLEMESFK